MAIYCAKNSNTLLSTKDYKNKQTNKQTNKTKQKTKLLYYNMWLSIEDSNTSLSTEDSNVNDFILLSTEDSNCHLLKIAI